MVTPVGKPGLNPEKDVSVPINWACKCFSHFYLIKKGSISFSSRILLDLLLSNRQPPLYGLDDWCTF